MGVPPRSTRTVTLFPVTTLFRSRAGLAARAARGLRAAGAPAADERRALRRAAVGRARLVAGGRLRGPLRAQAGRGRRRIGSLVAAAALVRDRPGRHAPPGQNGSASWRDRMCTDVYMSVVARSLKKKKKNTGEEKKRVGTR